MRDLKSAIDNDNLVDAIEAWRSVEEDKVSLEYLKRFQAMLNSNNIWSDYRGILNAIKQRGANEKNLL